MAGRFPLVLDYLFAKYFGSVSVDDCAQTEIACCPYGPVRGPGTIYSNLEPVHMENTLSQICHNRRSKCTPKLPLEL